MILVFLWLACFLSMNWILKDKVLQAGLLSPPTLLGIFPCLILLPGTYHHPPHCIIYSSVVFCYLFQLERPRGQWVLSICFHWFVQWLTGWKNESIVIFRTFWKQHDIIWGYDIKWPWTINLIFPNCTSSHVHMVIIIYLLMLCHNRIWFI